MEINFAFLSKIDKLWSIITVDKLIFFDTVILLLTYLQIHNYTTFKLHKHNFYKINK